MKVQHMFFLTLLMTSFHFAAHADELDLDTCREKAKGKMTPSEFQKCEPMLTKLGITAAPAPAAATANAGSTDTTQACIKQLMGATDEGPQTKNKKSASKAKYPGSDALDDCLELSESKMSTLYGEGKSGGGFNWAAQVIKTNECAQELCKNPVGMDQINALAAVKEGKCADKMQMAARCDAAAYLINAFGRNWKNPDHIKEATVKGSSSIAIECKSIGIETLDFDGCKSFVSNGEIMEAAQAAVQTGQELYYKDKTATAQMEAASNTDSATANLQALKTGVKSQEDMMTQRAALDTAKLAGLGKIYMDIPSREDVQSKCAGWKSQASSKGLSPNGCDDAMSISGTNNGFAFFMNEQAKEKMKAKLVQVGVNVGSDAVMASLMAKRASDLDNAIAKVDAFKPIDPTAPTTDATTTYCSQNPSASQCLTSALDRTFDAMSDNVINFGDGGTGAVYAANPTTTDSTGTSTGTSTTTASTPTTVGSAIVDSAQKSGLADTVAAAAIKNGAAPAGGGGGGGGGGGSVGGGGGGGGTPSAGAQGGVTAAIQGKTPTYNGGSFSILGGSGLKGAKSTTKTEDNPFSKLLGKDGNKSGSLDFGRSPASTKVGSKNDNLFDMISNRYSVVSKDKRLLEYELAK